MKTSLINPAYMDIIQIDFDALKQAHWSEQETQNAALITDFVQNIMNNHDFDYILRTYGEMNYVQHNRNIPDSIKGVVGYVQGFTKRYPEYTYDVKRMIADGDYITFHSHATLRKKDRGNDSKGFNVSDTWKVVNGEIQEHWDSVQPIDTMMRMVVLLQGGDIKNANGVF